MQVSEPDAITAAVTDEQLKGTSDMQTNCSVCGAPIKDDSGFCPYCGARIPENVKKTEDTARLEEVRLKYELEEKKRQEINVSVRNESRALKIKLWTGWLLCIASMCVAVFLRDPGSGKKSPLFTVCAVIFFASFIYALVITFASLIHKFRNRKRK